MSHTLSILDPDYIQWIKDLSLRFIGLLICKEKDRIQAQYALESSSQPLGISEYELEKFYPEKIEGTIPSIEEIEAKLNVEDDNKAEIEQIFVFSYNYSSF